VTETSEGVAYLVEGVTFPPLPFPSVSFSGENLDHVGRMTMAPFASLPPWRRCLGSSCRWWSIALLGVASLLRLPSLSFLYIVQVALVVGWRMLCRCAALAVALPPSSLVESLWADALPPLYWLVGWMLCHLVCVADLRTFGDVVSYGRFSCWLALVWPRLGLLGLRGSPPSCFCCWVSVWSLGVYLCFFSFFSIFIPL